MTRKNFPTSRILNAQDPQRARALQVDDPCTKEMALYSGVTVTKCRPGRNRIMPPQPDHEIIIRVVKHISKFEHMMNNTPRHSLLYYTATQLTE